MAKNGLQGAEMFVDSGVMRCRWSYNDTHACWPLLCLQRRRIYRC